MNNLRLFENSTEMGSNANDRNINCNYPQAARDAGFKLRQYKDGPLDWRLMGSYEVDRILREQNFEQVDYALHHLSEAPLGSALETNILDSGIAKYFVMSQFSIQYLLFCRKFLDEMLGDLREAHGVAQSELAQTRRDLAESNNEIVQLNKRITHIETVRAVVYPCSLCPKNFISNEALNIHISRKHSQRLRVRHEVNESPVISSAGAHKDKEADVTLINTVKMQLEMKQLKERLCVAEKIIKERGNCGSTRKDTPRPETFTEFRSIGIQNNLMDEKEKDDLSEPHESENSEQKELIQELQTRFRSYESMQERFKLSNEKFIEEINQKLESFTMALNTVKQQRSEVAVESDPERMPSPALDNLERMFMEKINEISKASTAKLEEVVKHMDSSYNQKLQAMERDLKGLFLNKQRVVEEPRPRKIVAREGNNLYPRKLSSDQAKYDEDTFSIDEDKGVKKSQPQLHQSQTQVASKLPISVVPSKSNEKEPPAAASSDSNRTYVKSEDELEPPMPKVKTVAAAQKPPSVPTMDDEAESTDVTESLNDEVMSTDEASEQFEWEDEHKKQKKPMKLIKVQSKKPRSPRPVSRKDASKMVDKRLHAFGFDMKAKSMTHAMLKRVNTQLTEQRNHLKLSHPRFSATRNNLQQFVDNICSAKLSDRAETMLKYKKPLQPMEAPKKYKENNESMNDSEESHTTEDAPPENQDQMNFQTHLNRLLSKPAPSTVRADAGGGGRRMTVAQIHGNGMQDPIKPVPLPRKRVMFDTTGSSKSFDDSDDLEQLK